MQSRMLVPLTVTVIAALTVASPGYGRARDGTGTYRFDGRAISGHFHGVHGKADFWFSAVGTPSAAILTAKIADDLGNPLEVNSEPAPGLIPATVYPFKGRFFHRDRDDACAYYR